jgi:transposase
MAQAVRQDPAGAATNPPGQPGFRKRGQCEGFRIVASGPQDVRPLNRRWAQVLVPNLGWVRFRLSRPVPDARSYRVTRDRVGRWHVAFAAIPVPIPGPSTGEVVGIDRGVTATLALSDGARVPGSHQARHARLHARDADARRDWVEKVSTEIARGYDLIRIEDLDVAA